MELVDTIIIVTCVFIWLIGIYLTVVVMRLDEETQKIVEQNNLMINKINCYKKRRRLFENDNPYQD